MNEECRIKLLKIIPMLMSQNEGEILATVFAIQRVLEAYKMTMHDLASSIKSTEGIKEYTYNNPKPAKPNPHKQWTHATEAPAFEEVMRVCELFIAIQHPRAEDGHFMHSLYIDLNILKGNYYMSALEVERFNEVRRRYRI